MTRLAEFGRDSLYFAEVAFGIWAFLAVMKLAFGVGE